MACKLDIQAAFDSLSHTAVARFLSSLGPLQESKLLLRLITQSEVQLSFGNQTWTQKLRRGILQGSAFSAEIFSRCLDHYLTPLLLKWNRVEVTWLRDRTGNPLYVIVYADDLLVLATNASQLTRMLDELQDVLGAIGLRLARHKCQYIRSPDLPPETVQPQHFVEPIKEVESFLFLGILVGFIVTCQMTLAARLRMATNSFFGYMSFLSRTRAFGETPSALGVVRYQQMALAFGCCQTFACGSPTTAISPNNISSVNVQAPYRPPSDM